jgi:hypothetical protein
MLVIVGFSWTGDVPEGHGSLADWVDLIVPNRALAIAQEYDNRRPLRAPLSPVSGCNLKHAAPIEGQIEDLHESP